MSLYLTIPVADAISLANATVHQGNALTGLTAGVSYACYRLVEAAAPFTYTGEAVNVSDGGEASSDGNVTLVLANDGQSYEMTVAAGVGTVAVKGQLYAFDTTDILGKAPLILGTPGTVAPLPAALSDLDTVSYAAAPYLFDPSGGVPVTTLTTVRAGQILGQGADYAVTAFDRIAGFTARQNVTNGWGTGTAQKAIVAPLAYTPGTLTFGSTHALVKGDGILAGGADSLLVVANLKPESRTGSLFRDSTGDKLRAYFSSNIGRIFASNMNGGRLLNFDGWYSGNAGLETGDQICLMLHLRAATGLVQVMSYRNGAVVTSTSKTSTAKGGKLATADKLAIGYTNFGGWSELSVKGGYQDFRIWCDLPENIDITSPAVADWFIATDGSAKHPSIANSRLGVPRIWMPTEATQANALMNLGTAGDFTSKSGTFA